MSAVATKRGHARTGTGSSPPKRPRPAAGRRPRPGHADRVGATRGRQRAQCDARRRPRSRTLRPVPLGQPVGIAGHQPHPARPLARLNRALDDPCAVNGPPGGAGRLSSPDAPGAGVELSPAGRGEGPPPLLIRGLRSFETRRSATARCAFRTGRCASSGHACRGARSPTRTE
jgi:hypothetical protein